MKRISLEGLSQRVALLVGCKLPSYVSHSSSLRGCRSMRLSPEEYERLRSHVRSKLSRLEELRSSNAPVDHPEVLQNSDRARLKEGNDDDKSALLVTHLKLAVGP